VTIQPGGGCSASARIAEENPEDSWFCIGWWNAITVVKLTLKYQQKPVP
jgi:hypothetical protein